MKYIEKSARWRKTIRDANIRRLVDYLLAHPCVDCGERDPVVLQFDHVTGSKTDDIAALVYQVGWERVEAEIEKCVVRCANCHTRRTAQQFGWLRAELANHGA